MTPDWKTDRIKELLEENEYLKAQVAELTLGDEEQEELFTWSARRIFNMTLTEGRVLYLLVSRDFVTKDAMYSHIYPPYLADDDTPGIKILDVYICKLRGKLTHRGYNFETVWGRGWQMDKSKRDSLIERLST